MYTTLNEHLRQGPDLNGTKEWPQGHRRLLQSRPVLGKPCFEIRRGVGGGRGPRLKGDGGERQYHGFLEVSPNGHENLGLEPFEDVQVARGVLELVLMLLLLGGVSERESVG